MFGFCTDQASKYGVFSWLQAVGEREVIRGVFKFYLAHPKPGALINVFFLSFSALGAGLIWWSFRKRTREDKWLCIALGLILGGTLGNLFDRIVFVGVRDFLYFYLIEWPVFNVADCCLMCGAGLLLVMSFFSGNKKPDDAPAATATATAVPQQPVA